jgi:hypothetical protein
VKVVFPDSMFPDKSFVAHAGPKQGFGPDGTDEVLMNIADQLDALYPWWEFRSVELAPVGRTARYVFTYAGPRAFVPQDTPTTTESSTPEPETASVNTNAEVASEASATQKLVPSQELVQP